MSRKENEFYQYLGELWRLVLAIENLMRILVMIDEGEEKLFPNRAPYKKGDEYEKFPKSYNIGFDKLVATFSKKFPDVNLPVWFGEIRHALAHGMIGQINHSTEQQLIKFNTGSGKLVVEYAEELKSEEILARVITLDSIRSKLIS